MIVEGQVHGGIAQGVGQALLEHTVYDADGQLVTGSYMDYTMPRADDFCEFRVGMTVSECTHNPLGAKGCGEAGAIAAPAALMNAITDALGVEIDMPASREKVWRHAQARLQAAARVREDKQRHVRVQLPPSRQRRCRGPGPGGERGRQAAGRRHDHAADHEAAPGHAERTWWTLRPSPSSRACARRATA